MTLLGVGTATTGCEEVGTEAEADMASEGGLLAVLLFIYDHRQLSQRVGSQDKRRTGARCSPRWTVGGSQSQTEDSQR